jgi:hypothetical protein
MKDESLEKAQENLVGSLKRSAAVNNEIIQLNSRLNRELSKAKADVSIDAGESVT